MNAPRDLPGAGTMKPAVSSRLSGAAAAGPLTTAADAAIAPPAAALDRPASLLERARARVEYTQGAYAGAVTPPEAWALVSGGIAQLVDVRTQAEVHYVGRVPGARHVEWHGRDPVQVERFMHALEQSQLDPRRPLLLLCRSAVRSHHAAREAAQRGWQAYNVLEGFEGQRDHAQQRGRIDGWRFHGLPWEQD